MKECVCGDIYNANRDQSIPGGKEPFLVAGKKGGSEDETKNVIENVITLEYPYKIVMCI